MSREGQEKDPWQGPSDLLVLIRFFGHAVGEVGSALVSEGPPSQYSAFLGLQQFLGNQFLHQISLPSMTIKHQKC